ncbi:MAG TPA: glycosyltransferase [Bacteroidales bacterium]|nr:glycosyltransferase [Bacteroidales bacterium]HRX98254.1 glycosyltransferase [Bacteroidales bacterium]
MEDKVLLYAGRISKEKGVMELPVIYHEAKRQIKNLKLVVAGTGPAEAELKKAIPDAVYLGWVNHDELPNIYSSADLLILPSRFDTFSVVVLESLSCGLPVIAYKTKGPKDIIEHNKNGYVVDTSNEMTTTIVSYFSKAGLQKTFSASAVKRSRFYSIDKIMDAFLNSSGLKN